MRHLLAVAAACGLASIAQGIHAPRARPSLQQGERGDACMHGSCSETEFLGQILDSVAHEQPAATSGHELQPGVLGLNYVLRLGSAGVNYLENLRHQALATHNQSLGRLSGVLNTSASLVQYLNGVVHNLGNEYAVSNVASAARNDSVDNLWAAYQAELAQAVQSTFPQKREPLRILVVSPVSGETLAVDDFEYNLNKLISNTAGDIFAFALFHYDTNDTEWKQKHWYSGPNSPIVKADTRPLCKGHVWSTMTPAFVKPYDYIWLMDGDLRLDYFSWDLYRSVLVGLDPLVSQPSILPRSAGGRSTDLAKLRMVGTQGGMFPIAREVNRSEGMAPLISKRLWTAFHERLKRNDPHSIWYTNDFWDLAATLSKTFCDKTGVLLVNGSPLRHMNRHDLLAPGTIGSTHDCLTGCGGEDANCRLLSSKEMKLMREGIKSYCNLPWGDPRLDCREGIRTCSSTLAADVEKSQWVMTQAGTIATYKYRCKAPPMPNISENAAFCDIADMWMA
mmetsp:Transcript_106574/g.330924  ORF Transcript_106574/g.330924 Transcript_106574/m.330924 type:complete len:507 (+) Transcript_106574:68-1588(+)